MPQEKTVHISGENRLFMNRSEAPQLRANQNNLVTVLVLLKSLFLKSDKYMVEIYTTHMLSFA